MKFGIRIPPPQMGPIADPDFIVRYARLVESLGFESVWSGEHIGLPKTPDWWHGYPAAQAARGPAGIPQAQA